MTRRSHQSIPGPGESGWLTRTTTMSGRQQPREPRIAQAFENGGFTPKTGRSGGLLGLSTLFAMPARSGLFGSRVVWGLFCQGHGLILSWPITAIPLPILFWAAIFWVSLR
jgi:hypothetical protein